MLFDVINGLAGQNAVLDAVMLFAAGPLIYILGAAALAVALVHMRHRDRKSNLWLVGQAAVALVASFVVNRMLRVLAFHERPFQTRQVNQLVQHDPGVSFPSNHATAALTFAFVIGFLISRKWGWILFAPALLVAISRVYVGVHWPSDVICGGIVGLTMTILVTKFGRKPRPAPESADTVILPRTDDTVVIKR
ncbi:phosphatase PAP2 family protein [Kibdelosporangium philippinense]|uniref:Phosphatase PAP2 family protein n=1 Tax=Kibdelosporangium philippinense TaxID=211113 RepID=A0ABS8ZB02_9PSEU|nr:phosphatase PAP2 family protein [Kibdelosporangium philippinense]MCE7004213.1 phosphatase PAP2 family protein [Kibdelosporangium philippinense]